MFGIAGTFLVTEFIESSFLSPRIIGDRMRLNPALVIFAVLLGGKLWGVIGIFIAIPVVAVAKVILAYWWVQRQDDADVAEAPQVQIPALRPDGRGDERAEIHVIAEHK